MYMEIENKKNKGATYSIRGHEINYKFEIVNIENLEFYRDNPRISTILEEQPGKITDEVIDSILWDRDETHKLYRRIKNDEGLIHPLVVYNKSVLEGNTRLCCIRHLYNSTKEERWKTVKCHVITDELSKDEIYRLLCTEHIEGKIDWEPYEKANLYWKMHHEENKKYQDIEKVVGESTPTIAYRIKAYELMKKNGIVEKSKYSHFEQLVRNKKIQDIKKIDSKIEEKIVDLIADNKIPKAQDVRILGEIYSHKKARKRLFQNKEDINQVYHDLKSKAPMTDSPFMKNIAELLGRTKNLTREEREGISQSNRDRSKVEYLVKELIKLCKELDIKIHIPDKLKKG